MVYYALIKYTPSEPHYRYIVAAPDPETIDEWWRVVSEKAGVQWNRLAPDYYSFNHGLVWDSAPEFNDRLMYSLLNDRDGRFMGAFTQQPRTDHISGQTFFIRSKSSPYIYWAVKDNRIYASRFSRTRFRIKIEGETKPKVMIGKDRISITLTTNSAQYLSISSNGELSVEGSGSAGGIFFSHFKKGFLADGYEIGDDVNAAVRRVGNDDGEEWELVQ
ncbi:hypothetical protein BBK36DRAFT_1131009 [Trichoderma citrinoviride]|uniref:Uncharacterized protein n=1 Tax=Trichoderma citrinoviride TaxID=58853 RepID=A0A2T4AXE3_9HYPO|nr:hypothetical protein BBK36DRAFT_1131009 [Trichoderma citrinoviride]PTB61754.1 hypothetical protein BBK36DRAFT_1131009 [Trichoderma citrinoviride]